MLFETVYKGSSRILESQILFFLEFKIMKILKLIIVSCSITHGLLYQVGVPKVHGAARTGREVLGPARPSPVIEF